MKKIISTVVVTMGFFFHTASMAEQVVNTKNADDVIQEQTYKQTCGDALTKMVTKNTDTVVIDYKGSNQTLHYCMYLRQFIAKGTTDNYDMWTEKNVKFNPGMERFAFDKMMEENYLYVLAGPTVIFN